jgi:hypothetical protein
MNDKIFELAEQAHSYACKYAQQPDYNPHNPYNQGMYKQRYDSKFAELIVRECMLPRKPLTEERIWEIKLKSHQKIYVKKMG